MGDPIPVYQSGTERPSQAIVVAPVPFGEDTGSLADGAFFAYNPQEARDPHGEWTTGGPTAAQTKQPTSARMRHMNLGITPARSHPTDMESLGKYYQSTRYRGWLTDVQAEAKRNNVQVADIVKCAGVWNGSLEPSASVWLNGKWSDIKNVAKSLGAEYNQEGVMVFSGDRDDGKGALYTMPDVQEGEREKAIAAMSKVGVEGGRITQERDGTYSLEIADPDGTSFQAVANLAKMLGKQCNATPGSVTFLSGGKDYKRQTRQEPGKGITHAARKATAKFVALFADPGTQPEDQPDQPDTSGGWDREQSWQDAGMTVNPLPKGMAMLYMRGGNMLSQAGQGDPVEIFVDAEDTPAAGGKPAAKPKPGEQPEAKGQWLSGYVALSGIEDGQQGGPYDGQKVIWIAPAGHPAQDEGAEWPAHYVRHTRLTGKTQGQAQFKTEKQWQQQVAAAKAYVQPAYYGSHYNPMQWRDPETGRWIDMGKGRERYQPPPVAAGTEMGPDIGSNPLSGSAEGTPQQAQEILARYGMTPERMEQNIRDQYHRLLTSPYAERVKDWRMWYYQAAALSQSMARETGTSYTQAAIAVAVMSPRNKWMRFEDLGLPQHGEVGNQWMAYKILTLIGKRGNEVMDITPEIARKIAAIKVDAPPKLGKNGLPLKTKPPQIPIDPEHYNGADPGYQGMNLLGKHRVSELPAEALTVLTHNDIRGIDENVTKAILGVRYTDPDMALGSAKTRSFYNNIRFPEISEDATIDIFMERILSNHRDLMDEEVSEIQRNKYVYQAQVDALRKVADDLGMQTHELQAALWEFEHWDLGFDPYDPKSSAQAYKQFIDERQQRIDAVRRSQGLTPLIWSEDVRKVLKQAGQKVTVEADTWKGRHFHSQ